VNGIFGGITRGGSERVTENLKSMSQAERDRNLAQVLTGAKGLGDNWRNDLDKAVWGEKKVIPYGTGMFTKDGVGSILQNAGAYLKNIETEYVNLEKEISTLEKSCSAAAENAAANLKRATKDGSDEGGKLGLINDYFSNYASYVHEAVSVVSYTKQLAIRIQRARVAQAKSMLAKMLSYKKKAQKPENASYDGDFDIDAAMLEFDL
ncbi:MAG: hypothetical protein K2F99_02540, partial [Muribaculaceae bacterium]|nr:hypothetical protein [Muribaculaceae bacterium]